MSRPEPSADQLLAMAYADHELDLEARTAFEARLAREPALAREVAAQQRLNVFAREVAPLEPEDHEWARLGRSPTRRGLAALAGTMVLVGILGTLCFGEWCLLCSDLSPILKWTTGLLFIGLAVWFGLVLRGRMRTRGLDPYTDVKR